jgi:hypothetical protein
VNTQNDDLLIDRFRDAWKAPAAGPPPPDHPETEAIWDAATGRLDAEATAQVVDHLAQCSDCAEEWRLALALDKERLGEPAPSGTVVPLPLRPGRSTWWDPRWAAAAALVVAAIGLTVFLPKSPTGDSVAYRGTDRPQIESLVRDNAPVTRAGFKLEWKPVPRAVTYDLVLQTSGLDEVLRVTGLTKPEYDVPKEKLEPLRPASHLVWQVEAVFPDGTRSPRPATFRLTLVE